MTLLTGKIAALLANGLAKANLTYPIIITRMIPGAVDPDQPWVPVEPIIATWDAQGFEDKFSEYYIQRGVIGAGDRLIYIVANELEIAPLPGDVLTSRDNESFVIVEVRTDPARALWECHVRLGVANA